MAKYTKASLDNVWTYSIEERKSKVRPNEFAKPIRSGKIPVSEFLDSLPNILMGEQFRILVDDIIKARKKKKPVILMMGAHVVKVGCSPLIIDLLKRNVLTHIAMNSAAAIHDVELAIWGHTSEDVASAILDGSFGMARETGEFINGKILEGVTNSDAGYGEVLGRAICEAKGKYRRYSILATCYELGIPVTVHAAIGTDIVHQQPSMDGSATGELTFRDFRVLINSVKDLQHNGVVLNVGSAVILPEVFLKALTVARNLNYPARGFTTATFDMNRHYRPFVNVVQRPTQDGGKGFYFVGHHEILFPLLAASIISRMK
ncbi:MAG: hypothetical protein N3A63_07195 [Bacteroidetes bacterium]|nr:hypothetical protein [Bacteroidota bacterium]